MPKNLNCKKQQQRHKGTVTSQTSQTSQSVVVKRVSDTRSVLSDDCESIPHDNASQTSYTSSAKLDIAIDDLDIDDDNIEEESLPEIDGFEDKLLEAIDSTNSKSAKTRQNGLDSIRKALITRFCYEFVIDRKLTFADLLERSMKRKGEELGSAAVLSSVIFITMGTCNETDSLFYDLQSHLIPALVDNCISPDVRSKCATALSLGCFITSNGLDSIETIMDSLQSIFSASYFKGNGSIPNHTTEIAALHSSCIYCWTLLLTIHSSNYALHMAKVNIKKIAELLDSPSVDVRIAGGECIAVLHEIARDCDQEFEISQMEQLCDKLRMLATDSQKFRAKKDRRQQRSSFRDILRAVEERESPLITVKFGRERLTIDSWCRKRQYDALCDVLKSGMNLHLSENELLREIFELGASLSNFDPAISKLTKFERNMSNIASCKARTKSRSKLRDKRADVL